MIAPAVRERNYCRQMSIFHAGETAGQASRGENALSSGRKGCWHVDRRPETGRESKVGRDATSGGASEPRQCRQMAGLVGKVDKKPGERMAWARFGQLRDGRA